MPAITRGVAQGLNAHSGVPSEQDDRQQVNKWPAIGDLSCDIHPLFDPTNFTGNIDYAVLRPALQLATKFITTKELLPFWWTLFFSGTTPIEDVLYHRNGNAASVEFTETPGTLSDKQL